MLVRPNNEDRRRELKAWINRVMEVLPMFIKMELREGVGITSVISEMSGIRKGIPYSLIVLDRHCDIQWEVFSLFSVPFGYKFIFSVMLLPFIFFLVEVSFDHLLTLHVITYLRFIRLNWKLWKFVDTLIIITGLRFSGEKENLVSCMLSTIKHCKIWSKRLMLIEWT